MKCNRAFNLVSVIRPIFPMSRIIGHLKMQNFDCRGCSSTIIGPQWVQTAEHCIYDIDNEGKLTIMNMDATNVFLWPTIYAF